MASAAGRAGRNPEGLISTLQRLLNVEGYPVLSQVDGGLNVRLDLPLDQPGGTKIMREFLTDAAKLVGEFGGSLSGEHGDGRARS